MKQIIIILQILLAASCTKEVCIGSPVTCTHTIYHGYLACPDPQDSTKWVYTNCQSYTEAFEMSDCDTSSWLLEARDFDENRKINPNNPIWEAFAQLYPNECGCK